MKIIMIKVRKHLIFIYLVLNVVFVPRCLVKAVQDDISAKYVPIWLDHTVKDGGTVNIFPWMQFSTKGTWRNGLRVKNVKPTNLTKPMEYIHHSEISKAK